MKSFLSIVALAQGGFYLLTGLWPLAHRRSFEAVTGPKQDWWLVKTVGTLISVVGAVLALSGRRGTVQEEEALLGVGSAAGLAACDVVFVARGIISPVYLLDAAAEAGLIGLWALAWRRKKTEEGR